ncbi:3381_t:CDS:2 [Racocetra fulgida]|uniref:3381_t:CDS:1 n=1 Tax=Racocetra fulgida TaxID=60492 RepID=A0A9N9F1J2_9GLOM|nr:3381_t:CDS:2 [Racocetra fulgida]
MRDPNTSRSRGFGFLTFVDPSVVNTVLVKEHQLDGKIVSGQLRYLDFIIDPKRAIPREEQEKTEKIFVGGIAPEVTEEEFKEYFSQFGHVIDATLMVDRDTGRPRGFGFITFDSSEPVEKAMNRQDLEIRASALGGPSSSSRLGGGYRHSPGRDDGYGRDHHHHHGSPMYGSRGGNSRSGPTRSYSSMNAGGTGALYSSHNVRGQHNYHPYAR